MSAGDQPKECRNCHSLRAGDDGFCVKCHPRHDWRTGHTDWGSPYRVCAICGTSYLL